MPVRPKVPGVRWSSYIYLDMPDVPDINICGCLCLMAATTPCHYYLYLNETCYFGNVLANTSVIPLRTDIQSIYIATSQKNRFLI